MKNLEGKLLGKIAMHATAQSKNSYLVNIKTKKCEFLDSHVLIS